MKIAFATTVTRNYLPYLRALLNSIKINSPSVAGIPFICYTGTNDTAEIKKKESVLTWKEKQQLKELYPSVEFKTVDVSKYVATSKLTPIF